MVKLVWYMKTETTVVSHENVTITVFLLIKSARELDSTRQSVTLHGTDVGRVPAKRFSEV